MPESFGARLRQRREQRQISLTTIAEQTKIKQSLLEALERDDVKHWPSGIFRRAFMRAYAHAIGLDPEVVVREFLEHYPDPIEEVTMAEVVTAISPGGEAVPLSGSPPTRFRYLVGSAIDAITHIRVGTFETRRSAVEDQASPDSAALKAPAPTRLGTVEAGRSGVEDPASAVATPPKAPAPAEPDLLAAAHLCTELGRVEETRDAAPLLHEAARILDAVGLIAWVWDPVAAELKPALAHGYSDNILAQLPRVRLDTNNATAAAFRSAQPCVVNGSDLSHGALVVPLITPMGCAGVLAIELQHGSAQLASVRALVTIFAAQLARVVGAARSTEAVDRQLA